MNDKSLDKLIFKSSYSRIIYLYNGIHLNVTAITTATRPSPLNKADIWAGLVVQDQELSSALRLLPPSAPGRATSTLRMFFARVPPHPEYKY